MDACSTYDNENVKMQEKQQERQKQQIEEDIQKLVDIEQKILDYDLYLMALSKDGIPYELISKAIPAIEREINHVLENMNAGFHIELEMKDKMIDTFICYLINKAKVA